MSYSLWNSLQGRAKFLPLECNGDFPLAHLEVDGCRFLVAARSSSVRHPHTVNYAALARELCRLGCTHVLSSALCGGLDRSAVVPSLVILDQFIDMHRAPQLDSPVAGGAPIGFEDFSFPYCDCLRSLALRHLNGVNRCPVLATGCYVGVDGPRYETSAEVQVYRKLGGDVVGMTAVREAIAYRQAGLCLATVALVTNLGAGLGRGPVSNADIQRTALLYGDIILDCGSHLARHSTTFECACRTK